MDDALKSRNCQPLEQYRSNNLAVVFCLTNVPPADSDTVGSRLNERCEHAIWEFKANLTNDKELVADVRKACADDEDVFSECYESAENHNPRYHTLSHHGRTLSCLIERSKDLDVEPDHLSEPCSTRLGQLEAVVFSDYRLMGDFVDQCGEDVKTLKCGRVQDAITNSYHSQGKVVNCLMQHLQTLKKECQDQILAVAEYQADDFHLDRSLFLACQKDRRNLCPKVQSGKGRVYKCLMVNKVVSVTPHD